MPRVLIVAYGNPLRCDDGLAWRAAGELKHKFPRSEVEIICSHQLAPEMAETVSRFAAVIFVDAAAADMEGEVRPGQIVCVEVSKPVEPVHFSHHLSPAAVVALAKQIYGASLRAFSVTLTGECFDHGESLSPGVAAAMPRLIGRIDKLAQELLSAAVLSGESDTP